MNTLYRRVTARLWSIVLLGIDVAADVAAVADRVTCAQILNSITNKLKIQKLKNHVEFLSSFFLFFFQTVKCSLFVNRIKNHSSWKCVPLDDDRDDNNVFIFNAFIVWIFFMSSSFIYLFVVGM